MIRTSGSPLAGRIGREPVDQRLGGERARDVAVALAVAGVGIADVVAVGALGLEVVDDDGDPLAGGVALERLRERPGGSACR